MLTSGAAGWDTGTTLSLAFCALLSPATLAGADERRVNGHCNNGHCNNTLPREQQGLGPAWRTKNEGSLEVGAAMTG